MNLVDTISDDANQLLQVVLDTGETVQLELVFRPAIQRWSISVLASSIEIDGLNLCVFPNILRAWRQVIDFGLACIADDGVDPFQLDDFSTGRCRLYVLDAADVSAIEAAIGGS